MPLVVKQDVLRLQVPIHDSFFVEGFQGEYDFCCVEPDAGFSESLLPAEVVEKFSAIQEVHHHVKLFLGLESVVHVYEEGAFDLLHYLSFALGVVYLVALKDVLFSEDFHGEKLLCSLFLD